MNQTRVALLGLGTMGSGMARNLLRAGFSLQVYNRSPEKATHLAALGAQVAASPADAVKDADVVLSMLADDDASRAVWLGDEGALPAMKPGSIAVECGTVSPTWVAELQSKASAKGLQLLDAPVTGSRPQAEAGQLIFLAGGEASAVERATPVLHAMSQKVLHLGPVGSGAQLKLINNFLCGVQVASFAEALTWIERTGLNRETALTFLQNGAPGSGIFKAMSERMTRRTYDDVNFLLRLMRKDLGYAQVAAAAFEVPLSTAHTAGELFNKAIDEGHAEQDMSAVVEVLRAAK